MAEQNEIEPAEKRGRGRLIAAVVLLVIVAAFVIDNTRKVKVGFVVGDHETRLIYVLIVTVVAGVLLDRLWIHHSKKS